MIDSVRGWITSVVMVTMLLSVAQTVIPAGKIHKVSRFSAGLVLMIALLQPILNLKPGTGEFQIEDYEELVWERQEELEQTVEAEWEAIIEKEIAAYISDKADALGVEVSVRVRTETGVDGNIVLMAELTGQSSEQLAAHLEEELGIPRERQVWIHEGED